MKIFKRILIFITISSLVSFVFISSISKSISIASSNIKKNPIRAAVFLYKASDNFMNQLKISLEDIQKENKDKIEFTFFDGNGNQVTQNESIEKALNKKFDFFVINLVDTKVDAIRDVLIKIQKNNMPLILEGTPTQDILEFIKPYKNIVFIGTDNKQAGMLQGKIIIDSWNFNKQAIDKDNDNELEYIMLCGKANHQATVDRTKYSISTIEDAGIKTKKLALEYCNWDMECGKTTIQSLFLKYGDKIEAIISNNDAMAIGAIQALQSYGYNKGYKEKNILVVGVDAIPEAQELVNKELMSGTVIQDARAQADAIYVVGKNLVNGKTPLEGTDYKFDDTGIIIRMPYKMYVKS